MSFHFTPVKISSYLFKNDAYQLCVEDNNHLTISSVRTFSVNKHWATPDERGSGLQREYYINSVMSVIFQIFILM